MTSRFNRIFSARVIKGKIIFVNQHGVNEYLKQYKNGAKVHIAIRKPQQNRTIRQNAYYWGVVVDMLSKELGYEKDEMHDTLKAKFLSLPDERHPDLIRVKTTTMLTTNEFMEYCETIRRWAASYLSINIPDPNQTEFM